MTADSQALLAAARGLLQRPDPATAEIWPRATALLTRQALEGVLDDLWRWGGLRHLSDVRSERSCCVFQVPPRSE